MILVKKTAVIYVEDVYDSSINIFIKENMKVLNGLYKALAADFYYLPFFLESNEFQEDASLYPAFLKSHFIQGSVSKTYEKLKQLLVQAYKGAGLIWLETNDELTVSAIGCQLTDEHPLMEQFQLFASVIEGLNSLRQ